MRDISHKQVTLRTARATATIFCSAATIQLIKEEQLPKGNLFDVARAAAFLGAKNTPNLLPHCHPVSIDALDVQFEFIDAGQHGITITGVLKFRWTKMFPMQTRKITICLFCQEE